MSGPRATPFELPDLYLPWPPRLSPHLQKAREHTWAWARAMGIFGEGTWDEAVFEATDFALAAAYGFPDASAQLLDLIADWGVWAFYFDDWFLDKFKRTGDAAGAARYVDELRGFVPEDVFAALPEPVDAVQRSLADLWSRTAPLMPVGWRRRFSADTVAQMHDALWELANVTALRVPNPIEYLQRRRGTAGGAWMADLVELANGVELSSAVAGARPVRVLRDTAGDVLCLRNDLISYAKEIEDEGEVNNAVLVMERFLGQEPQDAANVVNELITSRMQQFENTMLTELPALFEEQRLGPQERLGVLAFAKGLQDYVAGLYEWSTKSGRYQVPSSQDDVEVLPAWRGPQGLGTAAARLWSAYQPTDRSPAAFTTPPFSMPYPARTNPRLDTGRETVKDWARRMGMLDGAVWDEQDYDAADLCSWVARTHPHAGPDRFETVSKWYVWASYLNDVIDKWFGPRRDLLGAKALLSRIPVFLSDDGASAPTPVNPVERALADLWPGTAAGMAATVRARFPGHVTAYADACLWALGNIVQQRVPDSVDYLEMRRDATGGWFTVDLLQYALEEVVPDGLQTSPAMRELVDAFADITGWQNDILSYREEIESKGELSNGVLVVRRLLDCDLQQAVDIANDLVTGRLNEFEALASEAIPSPRASLGEPDPVGTRRFIEGLRDWLGGDLDWQLTNARQQHEASHQAGPVQGSVLAGPTGLGTSSTRLLSAVSR